ncbi:hypothetical protein M758_UG224800 [Ceratodon purpureus]|nr:hypothetical protein M758_UG224800 [Ceratodon purpureus]
MVLLLCSLIAADSKACKWKRRGAWSGLYLLSYDVTVGYHRALLLSKLQKCRICQASGQGSGWILMFHLMIALTPRNSTVLVFNTGSEMTNSSSNPPLVFYEQGHPVRNVSEHSGGFLMSMHDFIDDTMPVAALRF